MLTLTPALSHRMGEGESSSASGRIQPRWNLQETGQAVPSPVGRVRGRFVGNTPPVRHLFLHIPLLLLLLSRFLLSHSHEPAPRPNRFTTNHSARVVDAGAPAPAGRATDARHEH